MSLIECLLCEEENMQKENENKYCYCGYYEGGFGLKFGCCEQYVSREILNHYKYCPYCGKEIKHGY